MTPAAQHFFERQSQLIAQGHGGRELWERLAADTLLPPYFTEEEAADVAGLTAFAMKQRRHRKMEPSYIAHSTRSVRYPRHELCRWMGDMLVDRSNR